MSSAEEKEAHFLERFQSAYKRKKETMIMQQRMADLMNPEEHLRRLRAEQKEAKRMWQHKLKQMEEKNEISKPVPIEIPGIGLWTPPVVKKILKKKSTPVKTKYVYVPVMTDKMRALVKKVRHPKYKRPQRRRKNRRSRRRMPMTAEHLLPASLTPRSSPSSTARRPSLPHLLTPKQAQRSNSTDIRDSENIFITEM